MTEGKRHRFQRAMSLLLAAALVCGMAPTLLRTDAEAIYHTDNAAPATETVLDSTTSLFAATPSGGMLRVVDGVLYVWGLNAGYGLGLNKYNGSTTTASTVVAAPTKHDFTFDGKIVKIMTSCNDGVTVLTDKGSLYSWGSIFWQYVFSLCTNMSGYGYSSSNAGRTPIKWDLSQVSGTLVDCYSSSLAVSVKDSNGTWYTAGSLSSNYSVANMTSGASNANIVTLRPIASYFVDRLQRSYNGSTVTDATEKAGGANRRTVEKVIPSYGGGSCFIVTSDPRDGSRTVFSMGSNNHGQNFLPDSGSNYGSSTTPKDILKAANYSGLTENLAFINANPDVDSLNTEGHNTTFIDASGSVWIEGDNHNWLPTNLRHFRPQKIYDATMIGARAVRCYQSSQVVVILTEDNSLYALGLNSNQFITTSQTSSTNITTPTQVFTELSRLQTITGVYVTELGVMVVTASGDTYYSGDTTKGTAGTGSTAPTTPGTVNEVTSDILPPIQPLTANELIFEIETETGDRYRYDPTQTGTNKVYKVLEDAAMVPERLEKVQINAGQICKLNVYFKDFGKLTHWVLPIRFNPKYINIVRGDGTAYEADRIVTPGALGTSVGIVKCFTNDQWAGGNMVGDGSVPGGFPRVCNTEGWVSLSGYTSDTSAKITGEVKMASIYFMAVDSMESYESEVFTIADSSNFYSTDVNCGYDPAGISTAAATAITGGTNGAAWMVVSATNSNLWSTFAFDYAKASKTDPMQSPAFTTEIRWLSSMGLSVLTADGAAMTLSDYDYVKGMDADGTTPITEHVSSAPQISFRNKSAIFTVVTNYQPTNASFPQVDWDYSIQVLKNGESYTNDKDYIPDPMSNTKLLTVSDFITVLDYDGYQLQFQVSPNYPDELPCVIRFSAETRLGQPTNTQAAFIDVVFRSFDPPNSVYISEDDYLTDHTMIYYSLNNTPEELTFHCDFPGEAENFAQTAVVWTLLDSSHNVLTGLSSDYARLTTPSAASGNYHMPTAAEWDAPSVVLELQHTTYGDEFFFLRVESAYDGNKFYEIKIKIQQQVTGITWKRDKLYMLDGGESFDLNQMITVTPTEYYDIDLAWEHVPVHENGPYYIYLSNSSGKVRPMEVSVSDSGATLFEQVMVHDTLSGISSSDSLKIAVITVDSPIEAGDVQVFNLLGSKADYARVYGLEAGDSVVFLRDYLDTVLEDYDSTDLSAFDSALAKLDIKDYKRFNNLTAAQLGAGGSYDFPLPDFLNSEGGELGFIIIRARNINNSTVSYVYDRMPVSYISDPCKVYGYVQLAGKIPGSEQNKGISVKLVGPSTPDPVETGTNGYFVFQEYILPGEYTMIISKEGYLTRTIQPDAATGYRGIVIMAAEEYAISTYEEPIELYPGDLDGNGSINTSDITSYVRNWYGQYDAVNVYNFAKYDFYDLDSAEPVINLYDLVAVTSHNGWSKTSYAKWYVPTVS